MNIPKYVSPLETIRSALGDLGYTSLMQTLEPDLIRWSAEASDFISRKKTGKMSTHELEVKNNMAVLCSEFSMLENVEHNCRPLTLDKQRTLGCACTKSCVTRCCGNPQTFWIDECYVHFQPAMADGEIVHVTVVERPMGPDGYPLVLDVCKIAVAEYIKWKICFLKDDPRGAACERRWYVLCVQARAQTNTLTQEQLREIGYFWLA